MWRRVALQRKKPFCVFKNWFLWIFFSGGVATEMKKLGRWSQRRDQPAAVWLRTRAWTETGTISNTMKIWTRLESEIDKDQSFDDDDDVFGGGHDRGPPAGDRPAAARARPDIEREDPVGSVRPRPAGGEGAAGGQVRGAGDPVRGHQARASRRSRCPHQVSIQPGGEKTLFEMVP